MRRPSRLAPCTRRSSRSKWRSQRARARASKLGNSTSRNLPAGFARPLRARGHVFIRYEARPTTTFSVVERAKTMPRQTFSGTERTIRLIGCCSMLSALHHKVECCSYAACRRPCASCVDRRTCRDLSLTTPPSADVPSGYSVPPSPAGASAEPSVPPSGFGQVVSMT